MPQATRNDVLKALDRVIDPQCGRSVVQQDMVQGLVLKDGHVGFALEVAPSRGDQAEPLRLACEKAVQKAAAQAADSLVEAVSRAVED